MTAAIVLVALLLGAVVFMVVYCSGRNRTRDANGNVLPLRAHDWFDVPQPIRHGKLRRR